MVLTTDDRFPLHDITASRQANLFPISCNLQIYLVRHNALPEEIPHLYSTCSKQRTQRRKVNDISCGINSERSPTLYACINSLGPFNRQRYTAKETGTPLIGLSSLELILLPSTGGKNDAIPFYGNQRVPDTFGPLAIHDTCTAVRRGFRSNS